MDNQKSTNIILCCTLVSLVGSVFAFFSGEEIKQIAWGVIIISSTVYAIIFPYQKSIRKDVANRALYGLIVVFALIIVMIYFTWQ